MYRKVYANVKLRLQNSTSQNKHNAFNICSQNACKTKCTPHKDTYNIYTAFFWGNIHRTLLSCYILTHWKALVHHTSWNAKWPKFLLEHYTWKGFSCQIVCHTLPPCSIEYKWVAQKMFFLIPGLPLHLGWISFIEKREWNVDVMKNLWHSFFVLHE